LPEEENFEWVEETFQSFGSTMKQWKCQLRSALNLKFKFIISAGYKEGERAASLSRPRIGKKYRSFLGRERNFFQGRAYQIKDADCGMRYKRTTANPKQRRLRFGDLSL